MKILKFSKTFDLIELVQFDGNEYKNNKYLVRKRYKNWLGKEKQTFMVMDRRGKTSFTHDEITTDITLCDRHSAELVFQACLLKHNAGAVINYDP